MLNGTKLLHPFWKPLKTNVRYRVYPKSFFQYMRNLPATECTQLANGVTVGTESRDGCSACVGLFMDAGSRYEADYNNGIAHFFEHIAFKAGTCSRSPAVVAQQMSCTGARFRCFTSREMVGYYAECLPEAVTLVVDLLADCVFNNALNAGVIERQKPIVYNELEDLDLNVNKLLFDYLHATAFQGTPLAQTVEGRSHNLYNFCDSTIKRQLERCFRPPRTVLAAVGGITHKQMVHLAEVYLCYLEPSTCIGTDPYRFSGSEVIHRDDTMPMANAAIAMEAPCYYDEDKRVLDVAAALVGAWDRTQYGGRDHATELAQACCLAHHSVAYRAFQINYKDCGLWGVQFMAPSLQLENLMLSVVDTWMKLCTIVTEVEVERAKDQVKTKILSKYERTRTACADIGRCLLYLGCRPRLYESIAAVDAVDAAQLRAVCNSYIYNKCPAVASVGPTEGMPEYNRVRSSMYWLRW